MASTGAAKAVAEVLPQFKGKLNGIALRVPTPNVSVVDLVVKVSKKTSGDEVNAAIKAAADGPLKGIINFETQPLVSSDFMQTDYSNSVDAALTMGMGEDLVKVDGTATSGATRSASSTSPQSWRRRCQWQPKVRNILTSSHTFIILNCISISIEDDRSTHV